jgi:hypothetical protein
LDKLVKKLDIIGVREVGGRQAVNDIVKMIFITGDGRLRPLDVGA